MGYLDHSGERCILDGELMDYWNRHKMPYGTSDEATEAIKEYCCSNCKERCHNKT